jgi:large conductance mechanosensitive channel
MGKEDQEVMDKKIAEGEARVKQEKKKKRKEKATSFWKDFKAFITRGNILDMAVGVIVGGAFTTIITALSNNILKPIINWILAKILGKDSLSEIYTFLQRGYTDGVLDLEESIYIDWGSFINAIINFLLIAFTLFVILRVITNAHKRFEEKAHADKIAAEKAAAEKKKAEDAAAAEAQAKLDAAKAETDRQFYLNVQKQTELLEQIAAGLKK